MKILALGHIALPVKDLVCSSRFYEKVLCLKAIPRPNFSFPGAWYHLGENQELHLIGREANGPALRSSFDRHFALEVADIQACADHLTQMEIPFRAPKQRPDGVWQIFLRDPDDYAIELISPTRVCG